MPWCAAPAHAAFFSVCVRRCALQWPATGCAAATRARPLLRPPSHPAVKHTPHGGKCAGGDGKGARPRSRPRSWLLPPGRQGLWRGTVAGAAGAPNPPSLGALLTTISRAHSRVSAVFVPHTQGACVALDTRICAYRAERFLTPRVTLLQNAARVRSMGGLWLLMWLKAGAACRQKPMTLPSRMPIRSPLDSRLCLLARPPLARVTSARIRCMHPIRADVTAGRWTGRPLSGASS